MISTVRAMDLSDGGEISVTTDRDQVILCDSTTFPHKRIYLTAYEALKLSEFLAEQADTASDF